jgi:hypothetical protein
MFRRLTAALVVMAIAGLLALAAWWLKTWRGERLRPALISLTKMRLPAAGGPYSTLVAAV